MAVTRGTKKWWIVHVAAGVATVALMAFGVTQCSGKQSERAEKEAKNSELVVANGALDSLRAAVQDATMVLRDMDEANQKQEVVIKNQRDTIEMQRDSIETLNEALTDCRNSKKVQVKKTPIKKAPVKKKPIKPQPVKPGCGGKADVSLDKSQNNGSIVVGKGCQNNVTLNNGSVNNGAIVIGDGNNVVVTTPRALLVADSLENARRVREMTISAVFYTKSK